MAQKFLFGPIVKEKSGLCSFTFINSSPACIRVRIRFRCQRCDNCVDLHMIYVLRMAFLIHNLWVALLCFKEVKKNAVRAMTINQKLGISRFVQVQNTIADPFLT